MAFQTVFKRYELKYMLTDEQKAKLLAAMAPHMMPDSYGRTTIRNIYFDTADHRLIRASLEKPIYKEKLRVRSYAQAREDSTVFVELKKKYEGVVYKRRIALCEGEAMRWLCAREALARPSQISREIDHFLEFYGGLRPAALLCYDREAFYEKGGGELRVTFDSGVLVRTEDISLRSEVYGTPLLEAGRTLMEIKCSGGLPMWLVDVLSAERIYKTSYSKYGTAYERSIFPALRGINKLDKERIFDA